MSAREVMRKAASDPGPVIGFRRLNETMPAYQVRAILSALSAAGYRLLGPDDAVTIENAFRYAREGFIVSGSMPLSDADTVTEIDRAIAVLTGGGNG